ncbi:MAG: MerR family transcriptional regulator [Steroidobacteraceae bacterium]
MTWLSREPTGASHAQDRRVRKACGATIKTLRFYDEEGLLEPARIDTRTGYRYYDFSQFEKLRFLRRLRALDFSIEEMRGLVTRIGSSNRHSRAIWFAACA